MESVFLKNCFQFHIFKVRLDTIVMRITRDEITRDNQLNRLSMSAEHSLLFTSIWFDAKALSV